MDSRSKPGFTTYLKVSADYKCTKEECGKVWKSSHVWGREYDGVYCDYCDRRAKLLEVADKTVKIDTFRCVKEGCGSSWQSIHGEEEGVEDLSQPCDRCRTMVSPVGPPQERFGRHYVVRCSFRGCEEKPMWEDFSLEAQKTQRCKMCRSPGTMVEFMKGVRFDERGSARARRYAIKRHNPKFCDMCQDIITQRMGRSCHEWRKVVAKVETQEDGSVREKIVSLE